MKKNICVHLCSSVTSVDEISPQGRQRKLAGAMTKAAETEQAK
jgi:hypothetical protein